MNKKLLGVGLIGAGRAGMIHALNYKNKISEAYMAAVADVSEEAAKAAASELGITKYYTDYKDLIKDNGVEAVIVVAPTIFHKQIVIDCANAGKDIFCEKPMAMTTEECDEMISACNKNKVKLQIGFMRRFDSSFREAKRLIKEGTIGDLVQVHSYTRGPSKPRPWMYDIKKSNGILAEVNSHDFDSIRWITESDVDTLYAVAGNFRNPEVIDSYPDYYDSVLMVGTTKNGVHFSIDGAAFVQYGYDSKMELIGTKGTVQVGRSEKEFVRCTTIEHGTSIPFVSSWMTLFADAYLAEDMSFVNCILNDTVPEVTGVDGRAAVSMVEAGNSSIFNKRIETIK